MTVLDHAVLQFLGTLHTVLRALPGFRSGCVCLTSESDLRSLSGWLSSILGFLGSVRNQILSIFVEYLFYGVRETLIFCKNSILKLSYLFSSSTGPVTVLFCFFSFLHS